jgi:hypothetical protein
MDTNKNTAKYPDIYINCDCGNTFKAIDFCHKCLKVIDLSDIHETLCENCGKKHLGYLRALIDGCACGPTVYDLKATCPNCLHQTTLKNIQQQFCDKCNRNG